MKNLVNPVQGFRASSACTTGVEPAVLPASNPRTPADASLPRAPPRSARPTF